LLDLCPKHFRPLTGSKKELQGGRTPSSLAFLADRVCFHRADPASAHRIPRTCSPGPVPKYLVKLRPASLLPLRVTIPGVETPESFAMGARKPLRTRQFLATSRNPYLKTPDLALRFPLLAAAARALAFVFSDTLTRLSSNPGCCALSNPREGLPDLASQAAQLSETARQRT